MMVWARNGFARGWAKPQQAAERATAATAAPIAAQRSLKAARELGSEIAVLDAVIADLLAHHDGYHAVPALSGIGPVLAAVIVAEIGGIVRFSRPARLSSWAGLTPRHRESDLKVTRGHISKMACAGGTVPLRRPGGVSWRWLEDSICTGVS